MTPLNQAEKDGIAANILRELSTTPYSCSSLTQLTSGTTNFVFRGILTRTISLQNDAKQGIDSPINGTVIVKHSAAFAALNKDLAIDVSRCVIIYSDNNFHERRVKQIYYANEHKRRPSKDLCSML